MDDEMAVNYTPEQRRLIEESDDPEMLINAMDVLDENNTPIAPVSVEEALRYRHRRRPDGGKD